MLSSNLLRQQFEGFLNLGGLPFDAFLKIGLHLRRHVAGFGRAVITDLAVQDREALRVGPRRRNARNPSAVESAATSSVSSHAAMILMSLS